MPYSMNGSENAAGAKFSWYNLISLDENRPTKKNISETGIEKIEAVDVSFYSHLFIYF